MNEIKQTIIPFFTFKGVAEEAMKYYASIFPNGEVISLTYFAEGEQGNVGSVKNGTFKAMDMVMMVMDMKDEYCPEFSWATTMLLNCRSEIEFDEIFAALAADGQVMMGPEEMPPLKKVAWITDKYGVTWQMVWQ